MHDWILTVPYRTVPARRLIRHLEGPAGFALAGIPRGRPNAVVRRIWDNAILSNPTKD